jgi:hypothetical protein
MCNSLARQNMSAFSFPRAMDLRPNVRIATADTTFWSSICLFLYVSFILMRITKFFFRPKSRGRTRTEAIERAVFLLSHHYAVYNSRPQLDA